MKKLQLTLVSTYCFLCFMSLPGLAVATLFKYDASAKQWVAATVLFVFSFILAYIVDESQKGKK